MRVSHVINKRHQTKHERHGVDPQYLTCKTLEKQEPKNSANQN